MYRRGICNGIRGDTTGTSYDPQEATHVLTPVVRYAPWDQNCARTESSALGDSRI